MRNDMIEEYEAIFRSYIYTVRIRDPNPCIICRYCIDFDEMCGACEDYSNFELLVPVYEEE